MYNLLSATLIEIGNRLGNIKEGDIKKIQLYISIKPNNLVTVSFKHDVQKYTSHYTGTFISSIPYKIAIDMVKPYKNYSTEDPVETLLGPDIAFMISYLDTSSKAKPMESCLVVISIASSVTNFDLIKIYDNEFAKGMLLVG